MSSLGWKDREYYRERPERPLLRSELIFGLAARAAATALLGIPFAMALGELAFRAGWLPGTVFVGTVVLLDVPPKPVGVGATIPRTITS